jgi:hypothetical protein
MIAASSMLFATIPWGWLSGTWWGAFCTAQTIWILADRSIASNERSWPSGFHPTQALCSAMSLAHASSI